MNHATYFVSSVHNHNDVTIPTRREKNMDRAVKASIIAFLIAVTLVSIVSNMFNEYDKKLRAAAVTCQASTQQPARPANTETGKKI